MAELISHLPTHHFLRTIAGASMPRLIYGTAWKKDRTEEFVLEALEAGFKGIDTACQPKHYHEPGVGSALKKFASLHPEFRRESIFIQTKFTSLDGQDPNRIPYNRDSPLAHQVEESLTVSLRNLGTSYIDSLILHSPMKTHEQTMIVWRVFEIFVDRKVVKQIGISNCYELSKFKKIYDDARIKPAVIQNRFYKDSNYDKSLREFCDDKRILYQSFWTLTANPDILSNELMRAIGKEHDKTVEQIFFAYLIHLGICPLTGTTNKLHMAQDIAALDLKLTEKNIKTIDNFFK